MERIYQQGILDHARRATGAGRLAAPDTSVTVRSQLCGDRVTVDLALSGGTVTALAHDVRGCALCRATASIIGSHAVGADAASLRAVAASFEQAVRETGEATDGIWPELSLLVPVHEFESRHGCVLLPFEALIGALDDAAGITIGTSAKR